MNVSVAEVIWAVLGLLIGAALSWVLARSRQREALTIAAADAQKAGTALQIELSAARERSSRVPELERELADALKSLSSSNDRKAALESEILRLPDLEARQAQVSDALAQAATAAVELRESNSRLTAELAAERENLAGIRTRLQEFQSRLESKNEEAGGLANEVPHRTSSRSCWMRSKF